MYVHVRLDGQKKSEGGNKVPGTRVTDWCELPGWGERVQTQVFLQEQPVLTDAEPFLYPDIFIFKVISPELFDVS